MYYKTSNKLELLLNRNEITVVYWAARKQIKSDLPYKILSVRCFASLNVQCLNRAHCINFSLASHAYSYPGLTVLARWAHKSSSSSNRVCGEERHKYFYVVPYYNHVRHESSTFTCNTNLIITVVDEHRLPSSETLNMYISYSDDMQTVLGLQADL